MAPAGYVLGALFTKGEVPNSGSHNKRMTPEMGRAWAESVNDHGYQAVLFTDADCSFLPVTQVSVVCRGLPHTYRFVVIAEYLKRHPINGELWCTDVRDVVMLNKPKPVPGSLYVGSESLEFNHWNWLAQFAHGCPFWGHMEKPKNLYNCGIVGGIDIVKFMLRLGSLNSVCSGLNDMHAFNYALQTQKNIVTGYPVHNVFHSFVSSDEWFMHH